MDPVWALQLLTIALLVLAAVAWHRWGVRQARAGRRLHVPTDPVRRLLADEPAREPLHP